jgi:anti-sigma factor RsiW
MTSCRDMELLMSLALDGLATDEEQQSLKNHLAACPQCAQSWEAMRRVSLILSAGTMVEPPPGFVGAVMERVDAQHTSSVRWMGGIVIFAGIAGLLAALLLIASLWLGGLWYSFPVLRSTTAAFIAQASAGIRPFLDGLQVPFRVLGPAPVACLLGLLFLVVGSATGLWAWILVQVQFQARSKATGLQ